MSAYLKQTDYVNAYDLARDKKVIEGQAKLSDLPRLKDMILPTEGTVTYRICGMTAKKGWPGAVMELATVVPLVCNRCTKPMDFKIEREVAFRFAKSEEEADSIPIDEDDDTEVIVGSDKLNIADWIEEELILSLPLVPAHEEGCQTDGPEESKDEVQKPNPLQNSKISKVCVRSKVSVECLIFQERKRNCCPLDFES